MHVDVRYVRRGRRSLAWLVYSDDRVVVRRVLVDVHTGEVLDEVWRDDDGRVRSWTPCGSGPSAPGDGAAALPLQRDSRRVTGSGSSPQDLARVQLGDAPHGGAPRAAA